MTRRTINLGLVGIAVAVVIWVASGLMSGGARSQPVVSPSNEKPAVKPSQAPPSGPQDMTGYALSMSEVEGLPSDLTPGTHLDIWVAWDPPITKEPAIRPLVRGAVYERTIPPVIDGQPSTAMVLVPEHKLSDLMYGDRYGALSAAIPGD